MDKERNSNFELMRIISMLAIVLNHFFTHGGLLANSSGATQILFYIVFILIRFHVNSFVLVSGYFECNKSVRLSKAIKLNNSVWFYSFVIMLIFILTGTAVSKITIIQTLLPVSFYDYWFLSTYLILYLISPLLNVVINNCNKIKMKKIIITYFILLGLLPYLTKQGFYNVGDGFSLYNFILLYFIGAYFRKYPFDKGAFMKSITKNKQRLILICGMIFVPLLNYLLFYFGNGLVNNGNEVVADIGKIFVSGFETHNGPFVLLDSICYFLFFSTLNIKSKFINRVASYTLGVYLISDNNYVRGWMYKFLGLNSNNYSPKVLIYVIFFTISIFIICEIIEVIRRFIFKLIYNTKLASKNRTWCKNFIKSFGIDINW